MALVVFASGGADHDLSSKNESLDMISMMVAPPSPELARGTIKVKSSCKMVVVLRPPHVASDIQLLIKLGIVDRQFIRSNPNNRTWEVEVHVRH